MNEIKVMILEDDETLSEALKEYLVRLKCTVVTKSKPDDAYQVFTKEKFDLIFADCLLPQMTGVEFIERVRNQYPQKKFKSVLMSGIYTDREFIQESVAKTKSIGFLKKPFNLEILKSYIQVENENEVSAAFEKPHLYHLFHKVHFEKKKKLDFLTSLEQVRGYDLVFIYSILMRNRFSGYIRILHSGNEVAKVGFSKGIIAEATSIYEKTFLGELLIQSGYVDPKDVQAILNSKSSQKIGLRLMQQNQLSPHGFQKVLIEQLSLRLSTTIIDEMFRVEILNGEIESTGIEIDNSTYLELSVDWVNSKLPLVWLKQIFLSWMGCRIVVNKVQEQSIFENKFVSSVLQLKELLEQNLTIASILEAYGDFDSQVLKVLYILLINENILIEDQKPKHSPLEHLQVLKKIDKEIGHRNSFQLVEYLGFSLDENIENSHFQKSLYSLLGAEPDPSQLELHALWVRIFHRFKESMSVFADGNAKLKFQQNNAKEAAEIKLKITQGLEEVKKVLLLNQYAKAQVLLNQMPSQASSSSGYYLLSAWTKLGLVEATKKILQLKEIEVEISQIPPEERYDAHYAFIVGFFNKQKGDMQAAKKSLEKAVALDGSFMPARRELTTVNMSVQVKGDVFDNMFQGLFKKKN